MNVTSACLQQRCSSSSVTLSDATEAAPGAPSSTEDKGLLQALAEQRRALLFPRHRKCYRHHTHLPFLSKSAAFRGTEQSKEVLMLRDVFRGHHGPQSAPSRTGLF